MGRRPRRRAAIGALRLRRGRGLHLDAESAAALFFSSSKETPRGGETKENNFEKERLAFSLSRVQLEESRKNPQVDGSGGCEWTPSAPFAFLVPDDGLDIELSVELRQHSDSGETKRVQVQGPKSSFEGKEPTSLSRERERASCAVWEGGGRSCSKKNARGLRATECAREVCREVCRVRAPCVCVHATRGPREPPRFDLFFLFFVSARVSRRAGRGLRVRVVCLPGLRIARTQRQPAAASAYRCDDSH